MVSKPETVTFCSNAPAGPGWMLNGSFLLNFQGLIPLQAPNWKRLLLVVDRPYSPRKMACRGNHQGQPVKFESINIGISRRLLSVSRRSSTRFTTHVDCTRHLATCYQCNSRNSTPGRWYSLRPDICPTVGVHSTCDAQIWPTSTSHAPLLIRTGVRCSGVPCIIICTQPSLYASSIVRSPPRA